MILRRVRLESLRCFDAPVEIGPLDERLTVIHGPNGAGKSTLLAALERALFDRSDGTSTELDSLVPWGGAVAPRVVIDFSSGGQELRLEKVFGARGTSRLLRRDGGEWRAWREGTPAVDWVRELYGGRTPPRGPSRPEHRGLAQLLFMPQGALELPEKLGDGAMDRLRSVVGAVVVDAATRAVEGEVRRRYDDLFTAATGKPKKGTALPRAESELAEAKAALDRARADWLRTDELRQELLAATDDTAALEAHKRQLLDERERLRPRVVEHRKLAERREEAGRERDAAERAFGELAARIQAIADLRRRGGELEERVRVCAARETAAATALAEARRASEKTAALLQAHEAGRAALRDSRRRAEDAARLERARAEIAEAGPRLDGLRAAQALVDERTRALSGSRAPSGDAIAELRRAIAEERSAREQLEATRLHVRVRALCALQISDGGAAIATASVPAIAPREPREPRPVSRRARAADTSAQLSLGALAAPAPKISDAPKTSDAPPKILDAAKISDSPPKISDAAKISDSPPKNSDAAKISDSPPKNLATAKISDSLAKISDAGAPAKISDAGAPAKISDGARLQAGEEREWTGEGTLRLTLGDIAEIEISGPADDVARAREEHEERRATVEQLAAALGSRSPDELEARRAAHARLESELAIARAQRAAFAPHDDLERRLAAARAIAEEIFAHHPDWAAPVDARALADEARAAESAFEAELARLATDDARARHAAAAALVEHDAARDAHSRAREESGGVAGELRAAAADGFTDGEREEARRAQSAASMRAEDRLRFADEELARLPGDPETELERVQQELQALLDEMPRRHARFGQAEQALADALRTAPYSRLAEREEEVAVLEREVVRARREAESTRLLHELFAEERTSAAASLVEPIVRRVMPRLQKLAGPRFEALDFDAAFRPSGVRLAGAPRPVAPEELSFGTRDQLAVLVRLALGELVAGDEPLPAVLDDPLVHADADRLRRFLALLEESAGRLQLLVLTCRPEDYRGLTIGSMLALGSPARAEAS